MKKRIKKCLGCLYLIIIFGMCLMPLLAMGVSDNKKEIENRSLTSMTFIYNQEGLNWDYLREAGAYFEDHFAFRQELITMDSIIKAEIFGIASVDDVIVGKNGWLYYTATLDDFQHKDSVSERMLFNIAHNLLLMQQYTESLGIKFLFTVAPNKNSLYAENMPERLWYQIEEKSDMERLEPWLDKYKVKYVNLFELFSSQGETLYYKRDSHWNQKGAVLVYNALLDACGQIHKAYQDCEVQTSNDYYGDLNLMLFPAKIKPEEYLSYMGGNLWEYHSGESVEDQIVITKCENKNHNLLMYRDSFGNSLIPLMAGEFSEAVFSKNVPYTMTDLITYNPDIVILEKVERHLQTLGKIPPVMNAPEVKLHKESVIEDKSAKFSVVKEGSYWKIAGVVDNQCVAADSRIFVEIEEADCTKVYEAFCIGVNQGDVVNDYGFSIYISEVLLESDVFGVKVLVEAK